MNCSFSFCRILLPLIIAWLAGSCTLARAVDVMAYAEESPPYHYTENGQVVGSATEQLRNACERAKLSCSIEILPWARAYAMSKLRPNTLLFSIVRTPEREQEFLWLSPVATEPVWIFGRPDSPPIHELADLNRVRIGAINGSSGIAFLRKAGISPRAIDIANSSGGNFRKFAAHRVDFVLSTESRLERQIRLTSLPFKPQKVIQIGEATSYFAMHPKSSPDIVRALQAALELQRRQ